MTPLCDWFWTVHASNLDTVQRQSQQIHIFLIQLLNLRRRTVKIFPEWFIRDLGVIDIRKFLFFDLLCC